MNPQAGECLRCGECCRHIGTPPVMPEELAAWPKHLRDVVEFFLDRDSGRCESDRPCYFWSAEHGCLIEGLKPSVCREFTPGAEGCQRWRAMALAAGRMPGLAAGQGPTVTVEAEALAGLLKKLVVFGQHSVWKFDSEGNRLATPCESHKGRPCDCYLAAAQRLLNLVVVILENHAAGGPQAPEGDCGDGR